jgi:hypothetical protein
MREYRKRKALALELPPAAHERNANPDRARRT